MLPGVTRILTYNILNLGALECCLKKCAAIRLRRDSIQKINARRNWHVAILAA